MTGALDVPPPARRGVGQGLINGTAWTVVHVAVSVPIAFLANVVVARSLGAVDYGRLAILTMILALATAAASLGVGSALMQFVTKASEAGRTHDVDRLVSGAQGYNIFVAAPLVAVVVAVVVDVPWPFLLLAIVFGIFGPAVLQAGPILLATQHRSDRAAQIAMISNLVTQVIVVTTVLVRPTASAVWTARIVATGVLMSLPLLALTPRLRRAALRPRTPWSLPRDFWIFAIPTGAAVLVSQLVTDRVQIFFLEWLDDSVTVGLYALAFGLAVQILAPVQAAVGPLLPAFAALRERGEEHARGGLLRVTRVAAIMAGVVLSCGLPALGALIPWIYGVQFAASADYFVVMSCAAGIVIVGSGSYASLMARLRGGSYLRINLVALVSMAAVALASIPWWGAWGAVASMVVGTLVRALLMVVLEMRAYEVDRSEMARAFAPVLAAIVAIHVVWFGWMAHVSAPAWISSPVGGLLSLTLFILAVRVSRTGLTTSDREALVKAVPGRLRRPARMCVGLVSDPRRHE
ncbi:lipopolysaccharide biosynthesis protein [Janibacter limosus]|uniref:lipopolysaccharide biosynthesis protein n=1 Tax=Janibacter limosus TaxID=53458 RepID=UPI0013EEE218|nr:lipopolysaccharide biosynthesis protein [Janibacter limosus]